VYPRHVIRRIAIALALAAFAGTALAGGADEAQRLATDADAAARGGDFARAAVLFRAAYARDPRPEYECNAGIAYWKDRDLPGAQLFLTQCLARSAHLDAAVVKSMRAVLDTVEDRLRKGDYAPVDVVVTPATAEVRVSTFGDDVAFVGSRVVWLPFGEQTITVQASGYEAAERRLEVSAHTGITLAIEMRPRAEPPAAATSVDEPPDPVYDNVPIEAEPPPPPPDPARARRRTWIAAGITGGAAAASVALYVVAARAADDAGATELDDGYQDAYDRAVAWRRVTYGAYVATAVSGAITLYLWTKIPKPPAVDLGAGATSGGAAVWLQGRF